MNALRCPCCHESGAIESGRVHETDLDEGTVPCWIPAYCWNCGATWDVEVLVRTTHGQVNHSADCPGASSLNPCDAAEGERDAHDDGKMRAEKEER